LSLVKTAEPKGVVRLEAKDLRADGALRLVELSRELVVIRRGISGVPMTIALPTHAFRGVSLRLAAARADGFGYELKLIHRDGDLSVTLCEADDDLDIVAEWKAWSKFFGLPRLVERELGRDEPDEPHLGATLARQPAPRRRGRWIAARRPRFLTRRKVGRREMARKLPPPARVLFDGAAVGEDRPPLICGATKAI